MRLNSPSGGQFWFVNGKKPAGLVLAAEVEYATQTTKDGSDGETTRISILAYYDW